MSTTTPFQLFSATLLIFFPAAAGAGIVPADLGAGADGLGFFLRRRRFADDVAGFAVRTAGGTRRCAAAKSAAALVQRLFGHIVQEIFERLHAGGAAENIMAD